jgi:hypothetical protein
MLLVRLLLWSVDCDYKNVLHTVNRLILGQYLIQLPRPSVFIAGLAETILSKLRRAPKSKAHYVRVSRTDHIFPLDIGWHNSDQTYVDLVVSNVNSFLGRESKRL